MVSFARPWDLRVIPGNFSIAAALYRVNPVPPEVLVFFFIPEIEALVGWLLPEASVDRRAEIANGYILPAPVNQEVDTCEGKETVEPGKVSD